MSETSDMTGPPEAGRITSELRGPLLLIGIDRPAKLNGFTPEMFAELIAAYQRLDADEAVRCGVLFAHGKHFTAGLDLPRFAAAMREGRQLVPEGAADPFGFSGPPRVKPLVVAVKGWCLTLGIELMLAADLVVAASDTRFRQHEVARGIMAAGGATLRMAERAGFGNAMRYLLTGDEFDAATALRLGFVQEVVPTGAELDRAVELGLSIAAQAPLAVQATRLNARKAQVEGVAAAVAEFREVQARLAATEDAAEGLAAFTEKRAPAFKGK